MGSKGFPQDHHVKDLALSARGRQRIAWAERQMPVLRQIRARFVKEKPLRGPGVDVAVARAAVRGCHPAMELVENRGDFTAQLAVAVADNVQQRAFVVGPEVPLETDTNLAAVRCEVDINGKQVAQATGDAVMGDPYASLAWLANKLAEYGRSLEPGQYVMSGSFTRQFPLAEGDVAQTRFDGIGTVALRAC